MKRKRRIYIQDKEGNFYRLCIFSNWQDKYGEFYLKIMFPDLVNVSLITGYHDKGIVELGEKLPNGIVEFTYHYRSGVSHFKDLIGEVNRKRNLPTLIEFPALFLLRFVIRSTSAFKIKKSPKLNNNDFLIPGHFDGTARGLEFVISRVSGPWNVINEAGKAPVHTYKIPLEDTNAFFHIADSVWVRPPVGDVVPPFEIFRYENPMNSFDFKEDI